MWEWLRRDPDYVAWHVRASAATRGAATDGTGPGDDPVQWGIHFCRTAGGRGPGRADHLACRYDPGTVRVIALPGGDDDPDAIDPAGLAPWLTVVRDDRGEHAVLSDGWHHIRIDVEQGSLAAGGAVVLHYQLKGVASAVPKLPPLRRLVDLCRTRQFARSLYPRDPRVERWLLALRVHDAMRAGASQSEMARVLFGDDPSGDGAGRRSDSLRSRVRRLVAEARRLAGGGYRVLMKRGDMGGPE